MDSIDKIILTQLQKDVTLPLSETASRAGISKTACWNRIRKMEEEEIIKNKVAILNNSKVNLPIIIFLSLTVYSHTKEWIKKFSETMNRYNQIIEVYRITGHEIDYLLKIVCASIEDYDKFQQTLIKEIEFKGMATKIVLKEIKKVYSLPLDKM